MKNLITIAVFASALLLTGCSAYKAGQTPDDVYFSPGKVLQPREDVEYQEYQAYSDDQYLRMKVQNNNLWSTIDDYNYWYDSRYSFGLNYYSPSFMYYGYNSMFYSPYYSYYYNPYAYYEYGGWGMYNPVYVAAYYKNPTISRSYYTGASNISAYKNKSYNVVNSGYRVNTPGSSTDQSSNRFSLFNNNYRSTNTYNTQTNSTTQSSWSTPVRVSSSGTTSNTGGASGGVSNSSRSSSGGGRTGRN